MNDAYIWEMQKPRDNKDSLAFKEQEKAVKLKEKTQGDKREKGQQGGEETFKDFWFLF